MAIVYPYIARVLVSALEVGGELAGGRAPGKMRGHVTGRAPPPRHVGARPRPHPRWVGGAKRAAGAGPRHVTSAPPLRLTTVTLTPGRSPPGVGSHVTAAALRSRQVTATSAVVS